MQVLCADWPKVVNFSTLNTQFISVVKLRVKKLLKKKIQYPLYKSTSAASAGEKRYGLPVAKM